MWLHLWQYTDPAVYKQLKPPLLKGITERMRQATRPSEERHTKKTWALIYSNFGKDFIGITEVEAATAHYQKLTEEGFDEMRKKKEAPES